MEQPVQEGGGEHRVAEPLSPLGDAGAIAALQAFATSPGLPATLPRTRDYRFPADPQPKAPVTVAWGTRDLLLVPRQARRARALLPHANHVWLPGCGHVPMSDDPARTADLLLQTEIE
ncbi:MAG: alpha/beta fold hydrolase [Streptosporangiaceae bacterium]